jgi:GT2 family glycosyltransferase
MAGARIVVGRTEPPQDQLRAAEGPFARIVEVGEARFFETCNVFYRRADLVAVGGFDEAFVTPAGEDTDLAMRISPQGEGVVFATDALVHHDVRPSNFLAAAREALRWIDIPRVIARHPGARGALLHKRYFWKDSHPPALLAVVGITAACARRRPSLAAAAGPWLWFRLRTAPLCPGPRRRWLVLPGALALDLLEVGVMACGSLRHRALVL